MIKSLYMDLLELIKKKIDYFNHSKDEVGISRILSHLEAAELHFKNAKDGEEYLFNDVIYRSNQAYEGGLKESFRVLTGGDASRKKPHQIEKHFEENNVLKERVLKLFTNYRTEWRNTSTHDYKIVFTEQEAFLAIVNIMAFLNILLDQMIEKSAYDSESRLMKSKSANIEKKLTKKSLSEQVTRALIDFPRFSSLKRTENNLRRISEAEVIGTLTAYLHSLNLGFKVETEKKLFVDNRFMGFIDLFIEKDKEKVVIEVKPPSTRVISRSMFINQLLGYMNTIGADTGMLYIPTFEKNAKMKVEEMSIKHESGNQTIFFIHSL